MVYKVKDMQRKVFDEVYSDLDFAIYKLNNNLRSYYEEKLISLGLNELETSDLSCLDIGCGHGVTTIFLSEHFKKVIGVDFSRSALMTAKNLLRVKKKIAHLAVSDVETLPFKNNSVDIVFFKDLLHHVPDPIIALNEMRRVARSYVVGIEPNSLSLQMRLIAYKYEHERGMLEMNSKHLRRIFNSSGFRNVSLQHFGFFPHHLRIPESIGTFLLPILRYFEDTLIKTPLKYFSNYLIVCGVKE